ncbi:MAG TPA: hypothetical protein VEX18_11485 [Polyangiaceae bacterium]|nr:hypothetical protein [Polyangiaceae bacterium]
MFEATALPHPRLRFARHVGPALLFGALLAGCTYGRHDHYDDHDHYSDIDDTPVLSCGGDVESATIDADEALEVEAGVGAGVFIEYEADGTYHITTSCDSPESGECFWDILATPLDDALVLGLSPLDLENDDTVGIEGNSVRFVAYTETDFDGFTLETDAGAGLRVDVLLDEACGNRYMFWVGDGALHSGAPSNPIDLIPSD